MPEPKKRRYPADRLKLHALQDKLESEIAEKQQMLVEVKKLVREADNEAIVSIALRHRISPEEFNRILSVSADADQPALEALLTKKEPKKKTNNKEEEPDEDEE